ncbi:MAG: DUF4190 domain-containing protein [Acidobacteria bacterium]|nr:DUF4190 domain-containing protein [Acidobacteriota bacterium]
MKQCPKCSQTYSDESLNFCLNDGELLTEFQQEPSSPRFQDPSPATMILDQSRVTNPTSWPASGQGSQPGQVTPAPYQQPGGVPFAGVPYAMAMQSTGLAITSLCLGIGSLTVGWCCYLGVLLGPAAIITGAIYLVQNKSNPAQYPGRGLALGGVITGIVYFVLLALVIIIYGVAILSGGLR